MHSNAIRGRSVAEDAARAEFALADLADSDEPDVWVTARGRLVAIGEIGQGEFRPRRVFGN